MIRPFLLFGLLVLSTTLLAQQGQWITQADGRALIQPVPTTLVWKDKPTQNKQIRVESETKGFPLEGFGFTLTGGSAALIQSLPQSQRAALLRELVGPPRQFSFFRLSIGASDLDAEVFDYHPEPDTSLSRFSLGQDTIALIPLIKEMIALRPDIRWMATPWSPPVWMKTNGKSMGGQLKPAHYSTYARYLVKYLQAMQRQGIDISLMTMQNEPLHGGNNPSMEMSAQEQGRFLRDYLGPEIQKAGLPTEVLLWDHNADHPEYPLAILGDSTIRSWARGSAFHLYGGSAEALGMVQQAHPDKRIYFTEQWTSSEGQFGGDLMWHMKNVVIGALRQGAVTVLEWNLANDRKMGPHTPGGCTQCLGALTIDGKRVERNVAYYILGQISSFLPPSSYRLPSEGTNLPHVFFLRPDGKRVGLILNETTEPQSLDLDFQAKFGSIFIPAQAVLTVVW